MKRSAVISPCGQYRYRLEREWDTKGRTVAFIMVNPSTANAEQDDATIRKCLGFAYRWDYGRLLVANLFAYRATDIKALRNMEKPVGLYNTPHLKETMWAADQVVVAWGPLGKLPAHLRNRWRIVPKLAQELGTTYQPLPLACLGNPCKDGQPRHPLMVAYDTPRQWWKSP